MVSDAPKIIKSKLYSRMLSGAQRGMDTPQKPYELQSSGDSCARQPRLGNAWRERTS
jgi:hypothetical protein